MNALHVARPNWRCDCRRFTGATRAYPAGGKRQWSDLAIARTTPALFGLFSLITLWAAEARAALHPMIVAWYVKDDPTFSDAIATVRRMLWSVPDLAISRINPENVEIPSPLLQRLIEAVCYTT